MHVILQTEERRLDAFLTESKEKSSYFTELFLLNIEAEVFASSFSPHIGKCYSIAYEPMYNKAIKQVMQTKAP